MITVRSSIRRWLGASALLAAAQLSACANVGDGDVDPGASPSVDVGVSAQTVKAPTEEAATPLAALKVRTVELTRSGELVELDERALSTRGLVARAGALPTLAAATMAAPTKECVDLEAGEHVCSGAFPIHRVCPSHGLPALANCTSSGELAMAGQESWCCQ
jgi:hypothetical protein